MRGILWALAKGFIPIFRFFEAGDVLPVLEIRTSPQDSAWTLWMPPTPINAFQLFHNPELNMKLHFYSLVHELTQEHLENVIERKAEQKLCRILLFSQSRVQYRIRNQLNQDVIYTSEWFYAQS